MRWIFKWLKWVWFKLRCACFQLSLLATKLTWMIFLNQASHWYIIGYWLMSKWRHSLLLGTVKIINQTCFDLFSLHESIKLYHKRFSQSVLLFSLNKNNYIICNFFMNYNCLFCKFHIYNYWEIFLNKLPMLPHQLILFFYECSLLLWLPAFLSAIIPVFFFRCRS